MCKEHVHAAKCAAVAGLIHKLLTRHKITRAQLPVVCELGIFGCQQAKLVTLLTDTIRDKSQWLLQLEQKVGMGNAFCCKQVCSSTGEMVIACNFSQVYYLQLFRIAVAEFPEFENLEVKLSSFCAKWVDTSVELRTTGSLCSCTFEVGANVKQL